jgi:excisionase family DNA binding protein
MQSCRNFDRDFNHHPPTMDQAQRLLYSRKEAAYLLSLSVRAIDYLLKERRLQSRKVGGRILVPHDELQRFARYDRMDSVVPNSSRRGVRSNKSKVNESEPSVQTRLRAKKHDSTD